MKRRSVFLSLIIACVANLLSAKIITVDNKHPYAADYKTLQEAHDAASPGDVIYVSPSLEPYIGIDVTKRLTFFSVGFDISKTIGMPFTLCASIKNRMVFKEGSSGSQIEGFDGSFIVDIQSNNISIKKNNLFNIYINNNGSGSSILQNRIFANDIRCAIDIEGASNILIANNQLKQSGGMWSWNVAPIRGGTDLFIKNNVLCSSTCTLVNTTNSVMVNNIIITGSGLDNSITCLNNMGWFGQFPNGFGNLTNVNMNIVFVDFTNDDFHLLSNSPARGAGENGTDMGIYGGDAPYADGGFPSLPSILNLEADLVASPGTGLNVKFKAKGNK